MSIEGISLEYEDKYNQMKNILELGFPAPKEILNNDLNLFLGGQGIWELPWLLENLKKDLEESKTVLDLGCGTSVFPLYLLKQGFGIMGIDNRFGNKLKKYQKYLEDQVYPKLDVGENRVIYKSNSITKLPIGPSVADVIVSINVFDVINFKAAMAAAKEAGRVLKKGGVMGITMGDIHQFHSVYDTNEFFEGIQKESKLKIRGYDKVIDLETYLKENPNNKAKAWDNNLFGFILEKPKNIQR